MQLQKLDLRVSDWLEGWKSENIPVKTLGKHHPDSHRSNRAACLKHAGPKNMSFWC
jgi:hypothetical protein